MLAEHPDFIKTKIGNKYDKQISKDYYQCRG